MRLYRSASRAQTESEIATLIESLIVTEQRLEDLTHGEIDTVSGRDGQTFLLKRAQSQIRRSDALKQAALLNELRVLFDLMPDMIWFKDTKNGVLRVNQKAAEAAGKSVDEMEGRPTAELYPEDADRFFEDDLAVIRSGVPKLGYVETMRGPDGRDVWVQTDKVPYRSADGAVIGIVVIARDISDGKRAEEALRQSEERFFGAFEHAPVGMALLSPEGSWLKVNRSLCELFGYSEEELLKRTIQELTHPDDADAGWKNVLAAIAGETRSFQTQRRYTNKSGTVVTALLNVSVVRDGHGQPNFLIAQLQDISERDRVETALRENEERFREMLENVELSAFILDNDWRVQFCNKHLLQLTGWSRAEVADGEWLSMFIPAPHRKKMRTTLESLAAGRFAANFETSLRTKDGAIRELLWNAMSLRDASGNIVGVAGIGEDVTDRNLAALALKQSLRETELKVVERSAALEAANADLRVAIGEANLANRAKSEFLSRMSHELRTPMNSVLGYAQLLELQYDDPRIRDSARLIQQGGKHLLGMINEVLEIARIESGATTLSVEQVDLAAVLDQALGLVQPIADGAGINLTTYGHSCQDIHVQADRQRLLQVFINLLGNAIKFNRKGGEVSVRCRGDKNGITSIDVVDTGAGIAVSDRLLLFQPFQRFCDPGIEGTGLGLSLSERFVHLMGGKLSLLKSSAKGSTFRIELCSLVGPVTAELPPAVSHSPVGSLAHRKGTVLYIEDNPSNMRLLDKVLADWDDIILIPAIQGTLGLELAAKHQPDLLLLDIHLPDMSGDRVLTRLKADPATANIPVVILSADATQSQIDKLIAAGATDYLTKPIDLMLLFEVLRRFLPSV